MKRANVYLHDKLAGVLTEDERASASSISTVISTLTVPRQ